MELKLKDGDYLPDGYGGMVRLEGEEALLQRVLFRLTARRGALPFLPDLGSQLYRLGRERPAARAAAARQYVAEALAPESGLAVLGAELTEAGDGSAVLRAELEWQGTPLSVQLDLTL